MYTEAFLSREPRDSVNALHTRMRYARVLNDQLAEFLAARCEAEEVYIKQLHKATRRTIDPTYVPIQLRPVYERLITEVSEILHIHTTLAHQLQRDIETLQQLHTQGDWAQLARHDDAMAPVLKDVQSLETQRAKNQRKLDRKGHASTQQKLLSTEDALQHARQTWRDRVPAMLDAYESADGQRLFAVRTLVKNFAKAQGDAAKTWFETARTTFQAAHHFDPLADMEQFAGISVPAAPERFSVPLPSAAMHASSTQPDEPWSRRMDTTEVQRAPSAPPSAPLSEPDAPASGPPSFRASMLPTPSASREPSTVPRGRPMSCLPPGTPGPRAPSALAMASSLSHASRASSTSAEDREALQRVRDQLRQSGAELDAQASPPRRREGRASIAQAADRRFSHMVLSPLAPSSQWSSPGRDLAPTPSPQILEQVQPPAPTSAPVPLHLHICERVNALWKGHELAKVMVVGEVRVTIDASLPRHGTMPLVLEGHDSLAQVRTRSGICTLSDANTYDLHLEALGNAGDSVTILDYEVHVPSDTRQACVPLLLDAQWRCEPQQSSVLCTFRANPAFASPTPLDHLSFQVCIPTDTPVAGGVLAEPVADWDPDTQTLQWQQPSLENASRSGRLAARFPLTTQGQPQPVSATWTLVDRLISRINVRGAPHAPTRALVAGKYFVQP
ncbi:hypothetical protein MNAN1_000333 [Malassezia nana]|uniref:MHD domain-containing protein n=1 Tax=Malassezia nana TaxID=180528 RepID=A0AAF0ENL5_9BASI|nr:hypothetical protein MNAN1_000333 [Malassezia nana]